ncbi:T9SS type A sorting domain-containing protein [Mesonia mobilis]|uniref:T9SS type A sorting domain-containing protein n=1 Tax=Mesonia mobilis TaxID=369791 RepID=UPI0034E84F64
MYRLCRSAFKLIEQSSGSLSSSTFKKNTIKVYPNPSDYFFSIDSEDQGYYSIYNHIGQLIKTGEISTGVNLIQHTLSSGVYSISINSEQNKTLKKLVVR